MYLGCPFWVGVHDPHEPPWLVAPYRDSSEIYRAVHLAYGVEEVCGRRRAVDVVDEEIK